MHFGCSVNFQYKNINWIWTKLQKQIRAQMNVDNINCTNWVRERGRASKKKTTSQRKGLCRFQTSKIITNVNWQTSSVYVCMCVVCVLLISYMKFKVMKNWPNHRKNRKTVPASIKSIEIPCDKVDEALVKTVNLWK